MKTYIKNIEELNEILGYENDENSYAGEEIGYGEKAVVFKNVTNDCKGETEEQKFEDFCVNAEIGTFIEFDGKNICKVINSRGDAENVYEDEQGDIHQF